MNLKTNASRRRLKPYREPYWDKFPNALIKGVSLGFRRSPETGAETWHVRVYVDGRYRTSNLGGVRPEFEYKEAYRKALDWAQTVKDAGPTPMQEFSLHDVIDEYLTKLQGNSSERNMDRRGEAAKRLNALLAAPLLKRKVNRVTARDITAVQREYQQRKNHRGEPIAPESVNRAFVHLIASLNYGHRLQMIKSNAAWKNYERLEPAEHKRRKQPYIPVADRLAFIDACTGPLKAFVSALHYTAARPSEIRRMKVSDVNLNDGHVRLLTYKGKTNTRLFPLPEGSPIRKLFADQTEGKHRDEPVFKTLYGKEWTQANLAKGHKAVRDALGMPEEMNTYTWRHCRITDWSRVSKSPNDVARLAGTSLEFIDSNYYKDDETAQAELACI